MRYVDEYRNPALARRLVERIRRRATRTWRIMEICGGQTHTLIRYGIDALLEGTVDLIHGPGCPVCVTPLQKIDRAIAIAKRPEVIFTTFGDMIRVPGSHGDLLSAKAEGADVRIVYSPLDALKLAQRHPDREVVFFAVGFETTAPANAMAIHLAHRRGVDNFSALVSHVLVPPAIEYILSDPDNRIDGFIAPGHVCTVVGYTDYEELARRYGIPFVVAGFEPLDLLQAISMLVDMLERGETDVKNQYARSVCRTGNPHAKRMIEEVFEITDMVWRGLGLLPKSGLKLRPKYARHDAELKFHVEGLSAEESPVCIAGEILQGKRKPPECPAFARECTPESPLGAPMVSSEGACAAYYAFWRNRQDKTSGVE
ncbi:MAG: hydrogenase formation protein HypD [Thermotogae bacterium]|nr:hydrogenase formation protein HypD [Thermotogota bacterium]